MVSAQDERVTGMPLLKLLGAFGVVTVVLLLTDLLIQGDAADPKAWVFYLVGGGLILAIYSYFANSPIWRVGTREVVMMAIGAVLYGIFSWATNIVQLPSVSLVSLRPAAALPAFFGLAFGPVVGFFTGAVGNILGDAIMGWGVYPVWDLGNGLMGMIPGLVWAFTDQRRATKHMLVVVGTLLALLAGWTVFSPDVPSNFQEGVFSRDMGPLLLLLVAAIVVAARYVYKGAPDMAASLVWGVLGVIVGMGFASIAGIWVNGYTPAVAILGEFLPAASSNIVFVAILTPVLLAAWQSARTQAGR
jgi:uncharacterized membrane protein